LKIILALFAVLGCLTMARADISGEGLDLVTEITPISVSSSGYSDLSLSAGILNFSTGSVSNQDLTATATVMELNDDPTVAAADYTPPIVTTSDTSSVVVANPYSTDVTLNSLTDDAFTAIVANYSPTVVTVNDTSSVLVANPYSTAIAVSVASVPVIEPVLISFGPDTISALGSPASIAAISSTSLDVRHTTDLVRRTGNGVAGEYQPLIPVAPEPSTWALLVGGLVLLSLRRICSRRTVC
jgi:hypothetical protein